MSEQNENGDKLGSTSLNFLVWFTSKPIRGITDEGKTGSAEIEAGCPTKGLKCSPAGG